MTETSSPDANGGTDANGATTENPNETSREEAVKAAGGASGEGTDTAAVEAPVPSVPAAPDPVAVITAERDKIKDQLLRTLADFDNFRKRSMRDKQDEYRKGKEDVLRELLPVFDNLERAATYARTGADAKAVAEGVQMVGRLFEDTLTRLGGTRLKSVGQAFDPNLHEAIQQVESEEHPAGTVAQELVAGYQLGDRLLRPAMVAVSKGAQSPPAPASETQN